MRIQAQPLKTAAGAMLALALAACQQEAPAPEPSAPAELPISTNALMVSTVDHSADYIFALGNGDMPRDDHDWDLVRIASYETILGGALTKIPGTGPNDKTWTANENWQVMASELSQIGREALDLTEAKSTDEEAWRMIGDRLVQNCLACHEAFKPEVPSQGILHEGTGRESRGESIFD